MSTFASRNRHASYVYIIENIRIKQAREYSITSINHLYVYKICPHSLYFRNGSFGIFELGPLGYSFGEQSLNLFQKVTPRNNQTRISRFFIILNRNMESRNRFYKHPIYITTWKYNAYFPYNLRYMTSFVHSLRLSQSKQRRKRNKPR